LVDLFSPPDARTFPTSVADTGPIMCHMKDAAFHCNSPPLDPPIFPFAIYRSFSPRRGNPVQIDLQRGPRKRLGSSVTILFPLASGLVNSFLLPDHFFGNKSPPRFWPSPKEKAIRTLSFPDGVSFHHPYLTVPPLVSQDLERLGTPHESVSDRSLTPRPSTNSAIA